MWPRQHPAEERLEKRMTGQNDQHFLSSAGNNTDMEPVRVLVSVGGRKQPRKYGRRKRKRMRRLEITPNTLLEKIYHNLKRFAKVTLSTKKGKEEPEKPVTNFAHVHVSDDIIEKHLDNQTKVTNTGQTKTVGLDIGYGENLIDPGLAPGLAPSRFDNNAIHEEYHENASRDPAQANNKDTGSKTHSLHLQDHKDEREAKILEYKTKPQRDMREINFFTDWDGESLPQKQEEVQGNDNKFRFLEFTNILIIAAGVSFFFIMSSGINIKRRNMIKQFLNCSGLITLLVFHLRQSSSTNKQTLPDTSDCVSSITDTTQVSCNTGMQAMTQHNICEDLYSLDSDYFLSSLEDISVQL